MKNLSDITKLVPPELLAVGNIKSLVDKIIAIEEKINQAESSFEDAQKTLDALNIIRQATDKLLDEPSLSHFSLVLEQITEQTSSLSLNNEYNLLNSEEFKKALASIKKAQSVIEKGELFSLPIGQQEDLHKDITIEKEHETALSDIDIGLSVDAQAVFALSIMQQDIINNVLNIANTSDDVIINQEILANLAIGGKASAKIKVVKLSAGFSTGGGFEIDTFYQTKQTTTTYKALWHMYATAPVPWRLNSIQNSLKSSDTEGYRAFSIKGKRKLSVWGSVSLGESIVTKMDVDAQQVDIDISAQASYTRKHSYEGDALLVMTKNSDQQLEIKVTFDEKTVNSTNFAIGLNAQFKGLDKVASEYADIVLGRGDELIALLEKYSTPGETLIEEISNKLNNDQWYTPIAKLILGEAEPDETINQMLLVPIQEFVDRELFSVIQDENKLAGSAIDYLQKQFNTSIESLPFTPEQINEFKTLAESSLAQVIKTQQDKVKDKAQEFVDAIKEKVAIEGKSALAPLQALGDEVKQSLKNLDTKVVETLAIAMDNYQSFKLRLQSAIEKSQNIKLAISHEQSKNDLSSKAIGFTVVFEKHTSSAQLLYQLLILGADDKANRLMQQMLANNEISIKNRTDRLKRTLTQKTTQGFSVLGYESNKTSTTVNELELDVDASGNIKIMSKAAVNAVAEGEYEKREATASISYGFAQSAINSASGADSDVDCMFDLSYTNEDKKLHTDKELSDIFASFNFPTRDLSTLQTPLPVIVSKQAADNAIKQFKEIKSQYKSSKVTIQMRGSKDVYQKMLHLNKIAVFNVCADYLRAIFADTTRKEDANTIIRAFMGPNLEPSQHAEIEAQYEPQFDDYYSFFEHISRRGNIGSFNSRGLAIKLKKMDFKNDLFMGLDGSATGTSVNKRKWKNALTRLSNIAKDANSTMLLPETLVGINQAIQEYVDLAPTQKRIGLAQLNKKLNRFNSDISTAFAPWIDVESDFADSVKEFLSKYGFGVANINYQLLGLFMSLSTLISSDKNLFITTIKLEGNNKPARVIVVQ